MDQRMTDRRLRKLEADLPAPAPELASGEAGLRQIWGQRFRSGEASARDFRVWFAAFGEEIRERILDVAQGWEEARATRRRPLDCYISRLVVEIVVTPPDEPTPAKERGDLLLWARLPRERRGGFSRTYWWQATLGLMAMEGPDGLPLRRELAARRARHLGAPP